MAGDGRRTAGRRTLGPRAPLLIVDMTPSRLGALVTSVSPLKNGEGGNGSALCARLGLTRCRSHLYFSPPPNPLVNPFWTNPTSNSIGSEARNPMADSLPQNVSSSVISVAMKVGSVNFDGDWMNSSA